MAAHEPVNTGVFSHFTNPPSVVNGHFALIYPSAQSSQRARRLRAGGAGRSGVVRQADELVVILRIRSSACPMLICIPPLVHAVESGLRAVRLFKILQKLLKCARKSPAPGRVPCTSPSGPSSRPWRASYQGHEHRSHVTVRRRDAGTGQATSGFFGVLDDVVLDAAPTIIGSCLRLFSSSPPM